MVAARYTHLIIIGAVCLVPSKSQLSELGDPTFDPIRWRHPPHSLWSAIISQRNEQPSAETSIDACAFSSKKSSYGARSQSLAPMTTQGDAPPVKPPPPSLSADSIVVSKTRSPDDKRPAELSASILPFRNSSPARSSSIASTPASRLSRTASPSGNLSQSIFSPSTSLEGSPRGPQNARLDDWRTLIIRSFGPTVGILASPDTEELAQEKGFHHGFRELVRPFGENIPGKVVVRDSVGASRSWEDYGIRLVNVGQRQAERAGSQRQDPRDGEDVSLIEEVLERYLDTTNTSKGTGDDTYRPQRPSATSPPISPYEYFLSRLLSTESLTPHEAFRHPVACVIAISSRNPSPIESLRQLYAETSQGLPSWVNNEFLRYYVLIHDEDKDDITKSTTLFDQMKRHFGLHCHLLRLRSARCVASDEDSVKAPLCEWLSCTEELERLNLDCK